MSCEIPDCKNLSTTTVARSGVFSGVSVQGAKMRICGSHDPLDVDRELRSVCEQAAIGCQLVNPFVDSAEIIHAKA